MWGNWGTAVSMHAANNTKNMLIDIGCGSLCMLQLFQPFKPFVFSVIALNTADVVTNGSTVIYYFVP